MNNIEQRIWEYIDGTLPAHEHEAVAELIKSSPAYSSTYQELLRLNSQLADMELDEPSMSFTRNVMEQVKPLAVPGSIKSLVDKRIIMGIAAFFVVVISGLLVYSFSLATEAQGASAVSSTIKLPHWNFRSLQDKRVLMGFLLVDMVIGLYILDGLLRRNLNRMSKSNPH